ncbi:DUF3047 domain-containing protein [Vineibacter terrae]|uniref:DUF3047 domain-containing protein n=1 Tax=Vineibacter terrae TaxID=2586908 RepID=UPI002E379DFD|nr:DUF3047 domain-containing protein [Vineibacter terrae]HEX2890916.1 DUF3047 domain-containing protein [Vineibacter terrae]
MNTLTELEDHDKVEAALARALERARDGVRASVITRLPAKDADWRETGIYLIKGQSVSLLSRGVLWISRDLDVGVQGNLALWYRVGDGPIAKALGATTSFTADRDGPLRLINHLAGQWEDDSGRFDPASALDDGALSVAVVVWVGDPLAGLSALARQDASGLAAAEAARLANARPMPKGWSALWRVGQTGIFSEAAGNGEPARIVCRCRADAGILKHPVDLALGDGVDLAWAWRVQELPSGVAEDQVPTHDYLSIAVEFDNGQDLTYFWSSSLPVETAFRCPLPWWDRRETHVVVRSGTGGLGRWLEERRPILRDYRRTVGGDDPRRIVGVWLIALSPFQRGNGACDFARIRFTGGGADVVIGP